MESFGYLEIAIAHENNRPEPSKKVAKSVTHRTTSKRVPPSQGSKSIEHKADKPNVVGFWGMF